MTNPVITVENLSKAYRIGLAEEIPDTITEAALGWVKAPLKNWKRLRRLNTFGQKVTSHSSLVTGEERGDSADAANSQSNGHPPPSQVSTLQSEEDTIWALRDVSFEVQEGEVLGIIGRNGAGKSTLLKILSRITEPTAGRAVIRGRVSSLLEVGTGFHPELTGRENIYMNGTILGMTKREIDRKFDEIVDFSGVEKFLDTPIKRYSSGMKVRLAFSVAAYLEPEILIIDEVLAVGDVEFQQKCLGKMQNVATSGRTVLFVSHNMSSVSRLCNRGILLHQGALHRTAPAHELVTYYLHSADTCSSTISVGERLDREGGTTVRFTDLAIRDTHTHTNIIYPDSDITLTVAVSIRSHLPQLSLGFHIENGYGHVVYRVITRDTVGPIELSDGYHRLDCTLSSPRLMPGPYRIHLVAHNVNDRLDLVPDAAHFEVHARDVFKTGRLPSEGTVVPKCNWRFPVQPSAPDGNLDLIKS